MQNELRDRVHREIEQELGFGIVPNVFRAMDPHPQLLEANWNMFRSVVLEGQLPRVLKEMIGVVVSAVHGSEYARQVHLHSLGMQGVTKEILAGLAEGAVDVPGLPPTTIAALRFAQDAAKKPGSADIATLKDAGLVEAEIMEIVGSIELFSAVNAFTDTMRVAVDDV